MNFHMWSYRAHNDRYWSSIAKKFWAKHMISTQFVSIQSFRGSRSVFKLADKQMLHDDKRRRLSTNGSSMYCLVWWKQSNRRRGMYRRERSVVRCVVAHCRILDRAKTKSQDAPISEIRRGAFPVRWSSSQIQQCIESPWFSTTFKVLYFISIKNSIFLYLSLRGLSLSKQLNVALEWSVKVLNTFNTKWN